MYPKTFSVYGSELAAFPYCDCNYYSRFRSEVKGTRRKRWKPQRTSTPVSWNEDRLECNSPSESFSHSVSDFFYQSWKNELNSHNYKRPECIRRRRSTEHIIQNFNYYIVSGNSYPVWCPSNLVLVNICPYFTSYGGPVIYYPAVGYRADGTYGILPPFWYCYCS